MGRVWRLATRTVIRLSGSSLRWLSSLANYRLEIVLLVAAPPAPPAPPTTTKNEVSQSL